MIRDIGKIILINKYMPVQEKITSEKITEINIYPESKNINIIIVLLNANGMSVKSEQVSLNEGKYELLFSDADIFEEGKQMGSYRETDLWKVIDVARNETV